MVNFFANVVALNSNRTKSNTDSTGGPSLPLDGSQPKQPLQISSYLKEKDRYKAFLCEQQKSISGKRSPVAENLRCWEEEWARRNPNEAKNKSKLTTVPELCKWSLLTLTKRSQDFEDSKARPRPARSGV